MIFLVQRGIIKMAFDSGEAKMFNPQKEVSTEIVLNALIRHRDSLTQARTGDKVGTDMSKVTDNDRRLFQVQALSLIIASQRDMITISRPIIKINVLHSYKKIVPENKREEKPFEEWESDYKQLLVWLDFLKECFNAITSADISETKEDDFIRKIVNSRGENIFELTSNFYDMLEDLEEAYEGIYSLMIKHKIVSSGIEQDDELTEKELEQEMIRRIVEA